HYKKKLPDFASMTADERKQYIPPKSGGLWSLLGADKWSSIKPAGRDFDSQKGARSDQVRKATQQRSQINAFNRHFRTALGDEILSSKGSCVWIFGNLTRIQREIFEPLIGKEELRLAEILKPDSQPEYAGCAHCSIAAGKNISLDADSIVILEAGRCLADHIVAAQHCNRIILLGRNSPSYSESAQLILDAQSGRHADDAPEPNLSCPISM